MSKGHTIRDGSLAVLVRTVGFFVVVSALIAIAVMLVSLALGHLTLKSTLIGVGTAVTFILIAVVAERPFDPLRD